MALAAGGVLMGLIWLAAYHSTSHSQLARALIWLEADVDDHKRFPFRTLENQAPVAGFEQGERLVFELPEDLAAGSGASRTFDDFLRQGQTTAFLAIHSDEIVYEEYFNGYNQYSTQTSFSMAKSFLSTLVGIAIDERVIGSVEDPITTYIPELSDRDARFEEITIRDLLTMSSGIAYTELGTPWSDDATTYYSPDLRSVALSARIEGPPGEKFHYNNFHPLLLGLVLERATGTCVSCYLEEKLWKPLGMEASGSWSLDSEQSRFEKLESGINGRARDFARFGNLYLRGGDWDGRRIVSTAWVREATAADSTADPADFYQYMWWVAPREDGRAHFFARGNFGQYIYVAPDRDLVLVRFGRGSGDVDWPALLEQLAAQVPASD